MSEIERYNPGMAGEMDEAETGNYVHYDDHIAALAQARAEERERCERLEAALRDWKESWDAAHGHDPFSQSDLTQRENAHKLLDEIAALSEPDEQAMEGKV